MSESGVTRIALIIFVFVVSSITPLEIRLILWAGILLIIVDQIGLQGRWSGLIGAMLNARSAAYRQRILHHEAGHLVVACLFDIPVQGYVLDPWQAFQQGYPGYGGVQLDPVLESPSDIERYGILLMAGAVAEERHAGTALGGESDQEMIRQLWLLSQSSGSKLDFKTWQARIRLDTETLLTDHAAAFDQAVSTMGQSLPLSECMSAINQACTTQLEVLNVNESSRGASAT